MAYKEQLQRSGYVMFSQSITEKQAEVRLTRTFLQLLIADATAVPPPDTPTLTEVIGNLYDSNGVVMTSGNLHVKATNMISDGQFLFGTKKQVYAITGALHLFLAPSATVPYVVEFDPTPNDSTPMNLKLGYWKDTWIVPDTGTIDIADL